MALLKNHCIEITKMELIKEQNELNNVEEYENIDETEAIETKEKEALRQLEILVKQNNQTSSYRIPEYDIYLFRRICKSNDRTRISKCVIIHVMNNITIGKNGEQIAQEYLIKKGYKIIETNIRFSRYCEIDIIALDKDTLVFCEVKTRKTNICGSPFEAITKAKYQNIKKGIFLYLNENSNYKKFRIDAIAIVLQPKLEINHLKNI